MTLSVLEGAKQRAAYEACKQIQPQMTIGLGTGSTAFYVVERCGQLQREGYQLRAVATSLKTAKQATAEGIPLLDINEVTALDLAIDGVDEIDPHFCATKGGGAALLREKVVARMAQRVIWVMDASKRVSVLGAFPLPIEVMHYGAARNFKALFDAGLKPQWRLSHPVTTASSSDTEALAFQMEYLTDDRKRSLLLTTDNGNLIIDLHHGTPLPTSKVQTLCDSLPGIVETGIFDRYCDCIVVGYSDHTEVLQNSKVNDCHSAQKATSHERGEVSFS